MSPATPRGFRLAGVYCGIKKNPQKHDLALVVSDGPPRPPAFIRRIWSSPRP